MTTRSVTRTLARLLVTVALIVGWHSLACAAATPKRFESLEAAVHALVSAIRDADPKALLEVLGPEGRPLVSSGDAMADRRAGDRFMAEYDQAHRLEGGDGKVILHIGADDFPFPIPLVPDGPSWWWDATAGTGEILSRRIGRNELAVIQVCLAYVDAQREYYAEDRDGNGVLEYAQRMASTRGTRDGLYWEPRPGERRSPLGALVAHARSHGYPGGAGAGTTPYRGYLYQILLAQGAEAPGGASEYVVGGHMIGGFALVAFPAQYGVSGVMTFIVNHDGIVYQRDLGPDTARIAAEIKAYDPGRPWQRVEPIVTRP
jgi:hypothetical protein